VVFFELLVSFYLLGNRSYMTYESYRTYVHYCYPAC
jgi:hypothetical protein